MEKLLESDYIPIQEVAEKWNVSVEWVEYLISKNRIPGVKQDHNEWMIPVTSLKSDERNWGQTNKQGDQESIYLPYSLLISVIPDGEHPAQQIADPIWVLQHEAEIAYMHGDFDRAKQCFYLTPSEAPTKLCACTISMLAAVSVGDYDCYREIELFLKQEIDKAPESQTAILAQKVLALLSVSMFLPEMVPAWLKDGEISNAPPEDRWMDIILYVKYLQAIHEYKAMLAAGKTALTMRKDQVECTVTDIYLRLQCAAACVQLGRTEQAKNYLQQALDIGLPHGWITPFAETLTYYGNLMEKCLWRDQRKVYEQIVEQWKVTNENWISFHNVFTEDNIPLILSLQEIQVAQALCRGLTYQEAAQTLNLSVSRVKSVIGSVYAKLLIEKKSELKNFHKLQ